MKRIAMSLSSICLAVSMSTAQVQAFQQIAVNQIQFPFGAAIDEAELEAAMRVEIDAIQRLTSISDSAVKKLEVAAKAAIKSAVKKAPQPQALPFAPQPFETNKENTLSDEDAERKLKSKDAPPANFPALPAAITTEKIKAEEIWSKTLGNILNSQQLSEYQTFLEQRRVRERESAVQEHLDQLDSQLILTSPQREKLVKLIDTELGDSLMKQRAQQGAFGGVGGNLVVMIAGNHNKQLKQDDLKPILTPTQLAEWNRLQNKLAQGPLAGIPGMQPPKPRKEDQADGFNSALGFRAVTAEDKIIVEEVRPDSDAQRAGLLAGDIIDSINGAPIDTTVQLKRALSKIGKKWTIDVRRNGTLINLGVEE